MKLLYFLLIFFIILFSFQYNLYLYIFLLNKFVNNKYTEKLLHRYENYQISQNIRHKIGPLKIPTITNNELSNELFVKLSNNFRNPVLIKGFLKDTKAVKKWDEDYLKNIIQDFEINILNNDKLTIDNYKFNQFIDNMKNNNIYINNNHAILSNFPVLFNDIKTKFNLLIDTLDTNLRNIHIANLFIGYNKKDNLTGSNMHCGGSGNFFCMIKGTKRWTLIDPKYSCILKGRVANSGIHAQTLFDMPDTKLSTYPEILEYLPRYDIVLEPGDILWNAPWWWHRIENGDGFNVGLAIRNNKVTKLNLQNNLTYTLSGYTYLFYNSLLIGLYEKIMLKKDKHFTRTDENNKSNVLYQIAQLIKKYPKSIQLNDIINIHPKNK